MAYKIEWHTMESVFSREGDGDQIWKCESGWGVEAMAYISRGEECGIGVYMSLIP